MESSLLRDVSSGPEGVLLLSTSRLASISRTVEWSPPALLCLLLALAFAGEWFSVDVSTES